MTKKILKVLLIALILLMPKSIFASQSLEKNVIEYRLSNGMLWLLIPERESPTFFGAIAVRTGGIDEKDGKTGIAHMFEHMAFKGSERLGTTDFKKEKPILEKIFRVSEEMTEEILKSKPDQKMIKELKQKLANLETQAKKLQKPNDVFKTLQRNGAQDLNAYTTKDMTLFHTSLPKDRIELFGDVFSQMVFHPVFRDFYTERSVVSTERSSRVENNPSGLIYDKLLNIAFANGPYSFSTIGLKNDIDRLTVKDAKEFFSTYYIPINMVGVIVGDIDIGRTKRMLNLYFGSRPKGKKPPKPGQSEPMGDKSLTIESFASPAMILAYHKPTYPSSDATTFDVLAYLLCDEDVGYLEKSLIKEKKIASYIYCSDSYPGLRQQNLFLIYAQPRDGISLKRLEASIKKEIEIGRSKEITREDLKRIQNRINLGYYLAMSDNTGLAQVLVNSQVLKGSWKDAFQYPKEIARVTPDQISSLYPKYITKENSVVIYRNKGSKRRGG
ncbi:MAG: pitrilysin family protein [Pseudomonadota bacterium]